MSALIYYHQSIVPQHVADALIPDQSQCEVGVTCHRTIQNGTYRLEHNAFIGTVLKGEYDEPAWTPVVVLTNPHDEDKPVLACEDCAEWLSEVYGGTVGDADEVEAVVTDPRHSKAYMDAYARLTRVLTNMHHTERTALDQSTFYDTAMRLVIDGRDQEAVALVKPLATERGDDWRALRYDAGIVSTPKFELV
jgi:hypothetical protein